MEVVAAEVAAEEAAEAVAEVAAEVAAEAVVVVASPVEERSVSHSSWSG